jgi:two-component system sensor histidine kinase RegB
MLFERFRPHSSLQKNVRLIAFARVVLWLFAQAFLFINYVFLNLQFNGLMAQGILGLFALSAIATFMQLRGEKLITDYIVRLQLVFDVLIMTLLFHVTGGAANPFVSILLFPLIISASILPGRFTWLMVVLTMSGYGSLFLPSGMSESTMQGHHQQHQTESSTFSLHIIGMWFNFAISAVLISFFVVRMRYEIDQQQMKINAQREQSLRDEQLLGIATQAASAAHHMSTPLSTMSILVNDLQRDVTNQGFREDLDVLSAQLKNCKQVLEGLRHQAELSKQSEPADQFVVQLIDEFRLLRPHVYLEDTLSWEQQPAGVISSDPALRMAILNILNNAADASPEKVRLHARSDQQELNLQVTDFGSGFSSDKGADLDLSSGPVESSKENGFGIGLFLSHATINRHGGNISISSQEGQGAYIQVTLPLTSSPDDDGGLNE